MSNERDLLKSVAAVDCAKTALQAEIVKESVKQPATIGFLSFWVAITCPNHPKSYTDEEKQ